MERNKRVPIEVGRNCFRRCRMGLNHFVLALEHRPDHVVDEVVGQVRMRHCEIIEAYCLDNAAAVTDRSRRERAKESIPALRGAIPLIAARLNAMYRTLSRASSSTKEGNGTPAPTASTSSSRRCTCAASSAHSPNTGFTEIFSFLKNSGKYAAEVPPRGPTPTRLPTISATDRDPSSSNTRNWNGVSYMGKIARIDRAGFLPAHVSDPFHACSAIPVVTKPILASPASSSSMFCAGPSVANLTTGRPRARVRIFRQTIPKNFSMCRPVKPFQW